MNWKLFSFTIILAFFCARRMNGRKSDEATKKVSLSTKQWRRFFTSHSSFSEILPNFNSYFFLLDEDKVNAGQCQTMRREQKNAILNWRSLFLMNLIVLKALQKITKMLLYLKWSHLNKIKQINQIDFEIVLRIWILGTFELWIDKKFHYNDLLLFQQISAQLHVLVKS